jgi:predicted RNA-binding protein with RPS1 domain
VRVKVLETDDRGRVKLSMKAAMEEVVVSAADGGAQQQQQ